MEENKFIAYKNRNFMKSIAAREVRILSEYKRFMQMLKQGQIENTIMFFGSARAKKNGKLSKYYKAAERLSKKLTSWTVNEHPIEKRFIIATGGGPGIMEAASRGARNANGKCLSLAVQINGEPMNEYIFPELTMKFHYFFTRKFAMIYPCKAIIAMPGGFGTLDEIFEVLTLRQTQKMTKPIIIILYGSEYWYEVINFEKLIELGTISEKDLKLFHVSNTVEDAYEHLIKNLSLFVNR